MFCKHWRVDPLSESPWKVSGGLLVSAESWRPPGSWRQSKRKTPCRPSYVIQANTLTSSLAAFLIHELFFFFTRLQRVFLHALLHDITISFLSVSNSYQQNGLGVYSFFDVIAMSVP